MKIPPNLNIRHCNSCRKKLDDKNFLRCGVSLPKADIIFEYECGHCGHFGRYVLDSVAGMTPTVALRKLAELLETPTKKDEATKGKIRSELNKINGIQDILDYGGDDIPKELENDATDLP